MGEFELLARLRERLPEPGPRVALGPGDDAAVTVPGGATATSVDALIEGVHFRREEAPLALVGRKALASALSDLAAMGAAPAWALLALTLPRGDTACVDELADGFAQLAREHGVALVGGDTTRGPLCVSVAVHGFVPPGQALTRSGACVGDAVFVTGSLGTAAGGLRLVQGRVPFDPENETHRSLRKRLDRPTPRVRTGVALRAHASACIDVSDGLLADLGHVATASGVGIDLRKDAFPLPGQMRDAAAALGVDPLRFILAGGDDHALAATFPAGAALPDGWTAIGTVTEGEGVTVDGAAYEGPTGHTHFS